MKENHTQDCRPQWNRMERIKRSSGCSRRGDGPELSLGLAPKRKVVFMWCQSELSNQISAGGDVCRCLWKLKDLPPPDAASSTLGFHTQPVCHTQFCAGDVETVSKFLLRSQCVTAASSHTSHRTAGSELEFPFSSNS